MDLYDLYRLAKHLKFADSSQLFRRGIVILVAGPGNSFIPQLRFKVKPFRVCPFLEHTPGRGLCNLHPDDKPLICSMAPLAREYDALNRENRWFFVKPAPDCPGVEKRDEQRLSDFTQNYQQQLCYQTRFFNLMHQLTGRDLSESDYRDQIYYFKTAQAFESILNALETRFNVQAV